LRESQNHDEAINGPDRLSRMFAERSKGHKMHRVISAAKPVMKQLQLGSW